MSYQTPTPLRRARGLGAAKEGQASHWIAERIPAIGLILLMVWFVFGAVIPNIGASHQEFMRFMGNPVNAALMLLIVVLGFYHGMQGMLVIIGDYIGTPILRNTVVFILKLYTAFGIAFASFCILKLAVFGTPIKTFVGG